MVPLGGRDLCGLALLSASALLLEVSLTRTLSVALWHHFAVMVAGCAVLGAGASGTLLALRRRLVRPDALAAWPALFAASAAAAFILLARSPVDPYGLVLAHERSWLVPLTTLALAVPFLCAGCCTGTAYALEPARAREVYLADMAGAATGCLAAASWGHPAAPLAAALGGALACPLLARGRPSALAGAGMALALGCALLLPPPAAPLLPPGRDKTGILGAGEAAAPSPEVPLSPYKGLSRDLRHDPARLVWTAWGPSSRVDVLDATRPDGGSPLRFAPGLSLSCPWEVGPQLGVYVDGEPVGGVAPGDAAFTACLPQGAALPRGPGDVLVLRPGGGLDVAVAIRAGASSVAVAEPDPLLRRALSGGPASGSGVVVVPDTPRSVLARGSGALGAVLLTQGGSPFASSAGLATLDADELLTVEGLGSALDALRPSGVLVVTRYLHPVPRDEVKLAATIAEALRARGAAEPGRHMAAFATVSTYTLVASPSPLAPGYLDQLHGRCRELGWSPVLPDPGGLAGVDAVVARDLSAVTAKDPDGAARAVEAHPFDVGPPTDDRPFFARFFRPERLADLYRGGRTWEPLLEGGFVVPLMLAQALGLAILLVLLPLRWAPAPVHPRQALYFSLVGLAYMAVEVALLHRLLPLLGTTPATMAVALASLLASSGLGALALARGLGPSRAAALLGAACLLAPPVLDALVPALLPLPRPLRALSAALLVAPLGVLMGVPFPAAVARLGPPAVPAAWAFNGAASVVGSIAALQAGMAWGFGWVMAAAGCCYLGAAVAGRGTR